jgi:hypothetical protein
MPNPEDCTCANLCPEGPCIAIYIHGTQECWVACDADDDQKTLPPLNSVSLDARVSVETHNATVADVSELLGKASKAELLVPAASIRDRVIIDVKETTLAEVVDELGLVVAQSSSS